MASITFQHGGILAFCLFFGCPAAHRDPPTTCRKPE
jgi:hypothetical protein